MRKLFWIIIFLLGAFLLALWSPWLHWQINLAQLFGVTPPPEVGGLQVSSLAGEIKVYLNGSAEPEGVVTPESSPLIVPGIVPGEHQVRLVRSSEVADAYWEFNRLIDFYAGIDVVMAYELGPTQDFSAGHIIYAQPGSGSGDGVQINVSTGVDQVEVLLDDLTIGSTPVAGYSITANEQHRLKLSKEGYEDQEFLILPTDHAERSRLQGLTLKIEADMFLQPITVHSGEV
jgi:hypothetical protein